MFMYIFILTLRVVFATILSPLKICSLLNDYVVYIIIDILPIVCLTLSLC